MTRATANRLGWLAIAGVIALCVGAVQVWNAVARQRQIESVGYYRVRAAYTVKDTGERIDFDYVAACATVVTMYRDGDRSVDTPFGIAPKMMFAATRDGHAIQLVTPRACHGEVGAGYIPPDLIPLTIWHDDVNDLHFGWGYTSQDAYDNSRSRMGFEGATVTAATYADFMAWHAKAEVGFKPVGQIRSPWGYSGENGSGLNVPTSCNFYVRARVSAEIRSAVTVEWEKRGKPEFWVFGTGSNSPEFLSAFRTNGTIINYPQPRTKGGGVGNIQAYGRQRGAKTRWGQDRVYTPNEVYPYLPISLASTPPPTMASTVFPTMVPVSDDWKGLATCGRNDPKIDKIIEGMLFNPVLAPTGDRYIGEPIGDRTRPFLANDAVVMLIPQNNSDPPRLFFQRDEFALANRSNSIEGILP